VTGSAVLRSRQERLLGDTGPQGKMGNQAGSLRKHIETAEKTGALSFTDQKLEKFPPELAKVVANLRNLDLSGNRIKTLPENIGAFKMLKTLTMSKNQLESLPSQTGLLTKLENLNLAFNLLPSIPSSLQQLKNLKEIHLNNNKLTSFPAALLGLKQLALVDLSANSIPAIPAGIHGLEATELILNQNQISIIHEDLSRCPRLRTLRLEENCLALAAIPSSLLRESKVSLLCLEGNLFDLKKVDEVEGWSEYMERYTAVKRKMD